MQCLWRWREVCPVKRSSAFLTPHSTKQVLQVLVLSNLVYFPVIWSSAARKHLVELQLVQNRAARLALHCNQRADINTMHAQSLLAQSGGETDCISSCFSKIRNLNMLEMSLFVHLHTSLTHTLTPPDMPPGVFSQSPGPELIQGIIQYYTESWVPGTPFCLI